MIDLQRRLSDRFGMLRDARRGAVFFVEHGLDAHELDELRDAVRSSMASHPLESGLWHTRDLPLLVAATEVGYRYRGTGTDFWPLLESELEQDLSGEGRQRIKELFVRASDRFRGARPASTGWTEAFHLIAWPIAHALLPLEFHRSLAMTLANVRASVTDADDDTLYRAVRLAATYPTARFATLLEDVGVVVSLTRSLLGQDSGQLSPEIIGRLSADLHADDVARRNVAVARSIQRATRPRPGGALRVPAVARTKGALQLRRLAERLVLEARFPPLDREAADRLRKSLRRRRFAPQLWGASARVPSDQLLSGLPFALKLTALPKDDAPLFPDLDAAEFDPEDLALLHGFELELAPPLLFAVSTEEDLARQVHGSVITGHRKYWLLLRAEESAPLGAPCLGEVGPLRCIELDPGSAAGARALAQFGYSVRLGVSVRFAGTPAVDRGDDVPTFLAGDKRLLVPQRLTGEASVVVDLDGLSAVARASDVVRVVVEAGDHRVRVSNQTDSREYAFRGIKAPRPRTPAVRIELGSEERSVQALLGGRLSFVVDGSAPIDGLALTIDLDVSGRVFSATGPLGPIPQSISTEHEVMQALLDDDLRDNASGAASATLRARVGHLARAEWALERIVRPCWWEFQDGPRLLSDDGPLRFGAVSAEDPVRPPVEGARRHGTYLLAPVALDSLEFSEAASFATVCIAPDRTQLRSLAIAKPSLERRRQGSGLSVGFEGLAEAYLRWSLAETRSAIGDIHRGQIASRLEEWMTEVCCGPEWAQTEATLPRRDVWGLLEETCHELGLGRDALVELSSELDAEVRRLAVNEIRRSMPALWARIGPPSDLDDDDYEALDRAWARAYEVLAERYRMRGQEDIADALGDADPGESPDQWNEVLSRVRAGVDLRAVAAMLIPSNSAARLMALEIAGMTVDDVVDELVAWAASSRKAFAGALPPRNTLKASYALWAEPALAITTDWRAALDTLLAERAVARATRYLALRARAARMGGS